MKKLSIFIFAIMVTIFIASMASAKGLELSLILGMKDGSDNSDGVIVKCFVEEGKKSTQVFEQLWKTRIWSDPLIADLRLWANKAIILNLTTDPGIARNTGWDWIIIADAKILSDGKVIFDIGQAVAEGKPKLSTLVDGDKVETDGLKFGANCAPDPGPVGGQSKPKSFMQHPAWDGKTGNTISRYDIQLPATVELMGKSTSTWGQLKAR